jgi:hypothetical protein
MASGTDCEDGSSKRIRTLTEKAQLLREAEQLAAQQRLDGGARAAPTAALVLADGGGDGAPPPADFSASRGSKTFSQAAADGGEAAVGMVPTGSPLVALEPSLEQRLAQEREVVGAALNGMMDRFSQQNEQLADMLVALSGRMAGLEVRSAAPAAPPAAAAPAAPPAAAAPAVSPADGVAAALSSAPLYHALGQPGALGFAARPASRFATFAGKDGLATVTKQVALNGGQFVPPFLLGDGSLGFSEKAAKDNVVQVCNEEFGVVMVFGTMVKLAVVEGSFGSSLLLGHFAPQAIGSKPAQRRGGVMESATVFAEQLSSLLEGKAAATEPLPVAGDIASTLTALSHYGDLLARLYPGNSALPAQFKAWRRYLPALHRQAPQRFAPDVIHHLVNVALAKWAAACSAWVEGTAVPQLDTGTEADWERRLELAFVDAPARSTSEKKATPAAASSRSQSGARGGRDMTCHTWAATGECAYRTRGTCKFTPCSTFLAAKASSGGGGGGGGGAASAST